MAWAEPRSALPFWSRHGYSSPPVGGLVPSPRPLLVVAAILLGLNLVLPPMPFFPLEVGLGLLGFALLVLGFAAAGADRSRGAWVAVVVLLLVALPPVVPYDEQHCSDVPDPATNEPCEDRGTVVRPLGWTLLAGRAFGQGDLSSTSWTAPWWATGLAAAWMLGALVLAGRWRRLPAALR